MGKHDPMYSRQCGFTLVELVVTMIVIAIMAYVAVPRFSMLDGYDEAGYRDKVKAALQYARKAAISHRRFVCVSTAGNDVTLTIESVVPESTAGTCPTSLPLPATDRSCSPAAANKVCHPTGVTLTSGTIIFSAEGRPTVGAGTYTVAGSHGSETITVESESGYVH